MAKYLWRDAFCVGDQEVDKQHRKLFELLDQLYSAVCVGEGTEQVGRVLEELLGYTRYHFYAEETLMQEVGYPGYASHKQEHEQLMAEVQRQLEAFKRGDKILSIDLLEFMNDWLSQHILQSDLQISEHLRNR